MRTILVFALFLTCLAGCEKETQNYTKVPDGTYVGTFQRDLVWGENDIANITITFDSNTWAGYSDKNKYPALCKGTYSIAGDTIIFENQCFWTAEFDWSLILSRKYVIKSMGSTMEFYRDHRSGTADKYVDRYKIKIQEK